ncbi:hypothetical protein AWI43_28060 [Streptomyces sp. WAC04657]|nr:hypothetical protein AWI43_28060 [Streptomyces sp. WAC04657]
MSVAPAGQRLGPAEGVGAAGQPLGQGRAGGEGERGAAEDVVGAGAEGDGPSGVRDGVDAAGDGDGQRGVEPDPYRVGDPDDGVVAQHGGGVEAGAGRPVAVPGGEQEEGGDEQGGQFQPVLEGLDEGDAAHPAGGDRPRDDEGDEQAADPVGGAGEDLQGEPGALELRQQVQPADADDEEAGEPPGAPGFEPGLGEVGEGVRAGAAQRGGDEDQQDEVAGGVADRVPEHGGALDEDESGDAEEGGGGEVLAADGGGVEARPDGPRGDVEVGGGAGDPQAEGADEDGGEDDGGDGDDGVGLVHAGVRTEGVIVRRGR